MAKLPSAFNADEHEELGDFSAIPAGEYHVKIKDSELCENNQKTGSYIKFRFEIMEGEYKGRLLFSNLNIIHQNPKAVEIAEKELATICNSVGRVSIEDTDELHGCELMAKVIKKPASANYAESNEIKNYSAIEGLEQPKNPAGKASAVDKKAPAKKKKVSFDD